MTILRVPLAETIEGRVSTSEKDALVVNAYKETAPDGTVYVVKRAGLQVLVGAGSGLGNGVYEKWNINGTSLQAIYPVGNFSWGVPSDSGCLLGDGTEYPRKYGSMSMEQTYYISDVKISGESFALDIQGDGTVWSWGYSPVGWFTGDVPTNTLIPQQLSLEGTIIEVFPGEETAFFLLSDQSLWSVGTGKIGLGLGSDHPTGLPFVPVLSAPGGTIDTDWTFACVGLLVGGATYSCAVKNDGTIWVAGLTSDDLMEPLGIGTGWVSCTATAGGASAIFTAIKSDGTLWTFDLADAVGTLAQDTTISDVSVFSRMASEYGNTLFVLKTDGTLWAKGHNSGGECGVGTLTEVTEWTQVLPELTFSSIQETTFSSLMWAKAGWYGLWLWGRDTLEPNFDGVLGNGEVNNPTPQNAGDDWVRYAISQNAFLGRKQGEGEIIAIEDSLYDFIRAPGAVEYLLKSTTKLFVLSE